MSRLAQLPDDMVFFTQITMEAAEDLEFLDAMKAARIKGALVGVEVGNARGIERRLQRFQPVGRQTGRASEDFPQPRGARARIVHFRTAQRPSRNFRHYRGSGQAADLTFAQFVMLSPYPGTVDFIRWEKGLGADASNNRRRAADPALADSAGASSQAVLGPSGDVGRRNTLAHPGCVGQLLQLGIDLEALELHQVEPGPSGIRPDLADLSPHVCRHRHRDRQRARYVVRTMDALDGETLPPTVCGKSDARPGCASLRWPGAGAGGGRGIVEGAGSLVQRNPSLLTIVIPNRFIGEESSFAPKQQIPRAIRPRFGMTIPATISI